MNLLNKIFGRTNISLKNLIVFSILTGIIVGILNEIPMLKNTSFQDIAIVLDMWFVIAIFIIVNCKSSKEAVFKCFIYFLISQPLIYLTEIIILVLTSQGNLTDLLYKYFVNYYIGAGWLFMTILVIPGSYIAYQVKRDNIISAIILSVATMYLSFVGINGLISTIMYKFPHHLLNAILCLAFAYLLVFVILKNKKARCVAVILTSISLIGGIIFSTMPAKIQDVIAIDENEKVIEYMSENNNIVNLEYDDEDNSIILKSANEIGKTRVIIKYQSGKEDIYSVVITSKNYEKILE